MEVSLDLINKTGQDISIYVNGEEYSGQVIGCSPFELHIEQKEPKVRIVKSFFDAVALLFDKGVHRNQIYIPYIFDYKGIIDIHDSSSCSVKVAYQHKHVKVSITSNVDCEKHDEFIIESISDEAFRSFCILLRSNILLLLGLSLAILMLFLIFGGIKSLLLPAIVLILLDSFAFGSFLRLFNEAKKALRNNNEGSL